MKRWHHLTAKQKPQLNLYAGCVLLLIGLFDAQAGKPRGYLPHVGPAPLRFAAEHSPASPQEVAAALAKNGGPSIVSAVATAANGLLMPDAPPPLFMRPDKQKDVLEELQEPLPQPEIDPSVEPLLPQPQPAPFVTAQMLVPFFTSLQSNAPQATVVVPAFIPPLPPNQFKSSTATYRIVEP